MSYRRITSLSIFAHTDGISKTFAKSRLPDIKFHALRHTFSTRALEVGMDYKTLSEILGHSSVGITLDLYAHSLNEHKRNEMNKLGRNF